MPPHMQPAAMVIWLDVAAEPKIVKLETPRSHSGKLSSSESVKPIGTAAITKQTAEPTSLVHRNVRVVHAASRVVTPRETLPAISDSHVHSEETLVRAKTASNKAAMTVAINNHLSEKLR